MSLGERLRQLRGEKSQAEFGGEVGASQPTIRNYENNNRKPDSEFIKNVCNKYGVSADWLLFGVQQKEKRPTVGHTQAQHSENIDPKKIKMSDVGHFNKQGPLERSFPDYSQKTLPQIQKPSIIYTSGMSGDESDCSLGLVPMVHARLSAGHGSFETSANIESYFAFRMEFLRKRGQPSHMVMMKVAGNSMSPNIKNGDIVLIDQSQKDIHAGQIYAVGVEDMIYLKLIDAKPGALILRSINSKDHPPIEVPVTDSSTRQVPVLGRCIWSCHEW